MRKKFVSNKNGVVGRMGKKIFSIFKVRKIFVSVRYSVFCIFLICVLF